MNKSALLWARESAATKKRQIHSDFFGKGFILLINDQRDKKRAASRFTPPSVRPASQPQSRQQPTPTRRGNFTRKNNRPASLTARDFGKKKEA
jgi:hypothetical protein